MIELKTYPLTFYVLAYPTYDNVQRASDTGVEEQRTEAERADTRQRLIPTWILCCVPTLETQALNQAFELDHVMIRSNGVSDKRIFSIMADRYKQRRSWFHRYVLCLDVYHVSCEKVSPTLITAVNDYSETRNPCHDLARTLSTKYAKTKE